MDKITNFTQIKEIIEPIPADKFIISVYGNNEGQSCFLGHIHRKLSGNSNNYTGDWNGYGARDLTKKFLQEKHGITDEDIDGATVNNEPTINGYTEPEIKDRVMHMIEDAIAAGY